MKRWLPHYWCSLLDIGIDLIGMLVGPFKIIAFNSYI